MSISITQQHRTPRTRISRFVFGVFAASLALLFFVTTAHATVETFSTAGSSSWQAPAGVYSVQVECWGAGGGGGAGTTNNSGGGSGGGGGAYAIVNSFSVTPLSSYNYTVGTGGSGSTGIGDGTSGGNSTFNSTTCVAAGGGVGADNAGTAGAGGTTGASTGDTTYAGGTGDTAVSGGDTPGGGGGSSAGTGQNGATATDLNGATAPTGGGDGGDGGSVGTQNNGLPGVSPGGGGGGGLERQGGTVGNGGAGAAGQIRLTYTADLSVTYSGTLYSDEGNTTITTGKTVTLRIGTTTPSLHSTTTRADGTWAYKIADGSNISAGDVIHIWLDGVTEKAVRVTKVNNNSNVSGLDLYQNRVIVSHEAGQTSITNADLGEYDGDDDADIQFTSNTGALSVRAGNELHVWTGDTFAPGGTVTINGNAGSGVDGSFHMADSSTITFGNGEALYVAGNFSASSSATYNYDANSGTTFTATTTGKTIDQSFASLGLMNFDGVGGAWSFAQPNATTTGFAFANGTVTAPSGVLAVTGPWANTGGDFEHNNGTVHFNSNSAQSILGHMTGTSDDFNNVVFSGSGTKTFSTYNASTTDFTINSGASVTTGPVTSVSGNYTNNGSITTDGDTINFNGTSPQTIAGTMTTSATDFNNVIFSGGGTKTFSNNASTTNFTIESGALVVAPSNLSISGNYSNSGNFIDNLGTVIFNGGSAQAIAGTMTASATDFNNVIFSGAGTKTFSNNASTTNFTINSGATVVAPTNLSVAGNYTQNGSFTDSGGTVLFNGGSAQIIAGTMNTSATDFNNLIFSGAGTKTFSNNASTTNFTMQSGSGSFTAPTYLSIGGNLDRNGATFVHNSGTVNFNGNSFQAIDGVQTGGSFNHVIFSGTGIKIFLSDAQVAGNFTIQSGSGAVTTPTNLTISGNYSNSGDITNSGTINFNGASPQTLSGEMTGTADDFNHVVFSGAGTKTFSNNASTTNFTIQAGSGTVTTPTNLTISGNYSNAGDITNSGTINFNGSSAQTISGTMNTTATDFGSVIFSGAGTKTFSNNASTTDFTIQSGSGAVTAPASLSIAGNYSNSSTFTHGSGLIHLTGTSKTLSGTLTGTSAFNDLSVSGSYTASNNASTSDLTIVSGGTFVAPTNLTISGNYANAGDITNSGTINFNGGSAQTIAGTMTTSAADFNNLIFSGGGTKTFSNNASTTNFTIEWGSVVAPSVLTIAGDFDHDGTLFDANGGTIYFESDSAQDIQLTGANSMILGNAFSNIVFKGTGTKTIHRTIEVGDVTIASGASLNINTTFFQVNGDYTNNGSFATNDTVSFKGTSPQTISGTMNTATTDFANLEFSGAGTKTFLNNASTTDFTIQSGSGAVIAPTYLSISGNYTNNSAFTDNGGTVLFDGGTQTIAGQLTGTADDFNHVIFDGTGTKTFSHNASTSNFTITTGITVVAPTLLSITGNYTNDGTFTAGTGTTTLNGTSAQTLSGNMTDSDAFAGLAITNTSGAGDSSQSITFNNNASTTGTFAMSASTSAAFLAGGSYTFENIYLNGASGQYAWLRSTSPDTEYYFHVPGNQALFNYVNVQDNNACAEPIIAENGTNVDAGNNSCWSFVSGAMPTISSAANQNFVVGQATTTISTITITDTVVPNITATDDIRIIIATTSVDMKWDTTDTTATLGGTASGKASSTISYSANGDTLIIDVTSDFAGSDTLTISGLSFAQFNAFAAPTNALAVRVEGVGTTTNNTDDKTVSISGGLTLSDHSAGQVSNGLESGGSSGSEVPLYAFRLQGVGESVDIDAIVFRLSKVINILTGDLTNLLLYRDTNSDRAFDGGDVAVGGTGTPSISGNLGTITFGTTFTSDTTARDYLLIGDYEKVLSGETITISLDTDDISATGVTSGGGITPTGSADSIAHYRGGQSQGGGRSGEVGGGPPPGQGQQEGGDEDGGGGETGIDPDTGESLGNELGFEVPTTNSGAWTNGGNAYASDGSYASSTAIAQAHVYGTFGFTVPSANEIVGIEVKFEAHDSDAAGDLDVDLTWNGTNYTTAKNTGTLTATDAVYALGGPGDTWGRGWAPAEGDDGNFAVRFTSRNDATIGIDAIQVRIYHQTSSSTVGGGGGGGEVSRPGDQHFANVFSALHNLNPFTQIILFVSLMSLSIAFIMYLRERSRKGVFINPNECDDG